MTGDLPIVFKDIVDAAPALIWVSGSDKAGIWFNRTWLDYTGTELEDELGDKWLGHVHRDDLPAIQECADASQSATALKPLINGKSARPF